MVRRFEFENVWADNEKESSIEVHGATVKTRSIELVSANILKIEVGTNTPCGGDTGHGGRTFIEITNLANTDMQLSAVQDSMGTDQVTLMFGGDTEADTIAAALEYAARVLREQMRENKYVE